MSHCRRKIDDLASNGTFQKGREWACYTRPNKVKGGEDQGGLTLISSLRFNADNSAMA